MEPDYAPAGFLPHPRFTPPPGIKLNDIPPGKSEYEIVDYFSARAQENANGYANFLGAGSFDAGDNTERDRFARAGCFGEGLEDDVSHAPGEDSSWRRASRGWHGVRHN